MASLRTVPVESGEDRGDLVAIGRQRGYVETQPVAVGPEFDVQEAAAAGFAPREVLGGGRRVEAKPQTGAPVDANGAQPGAVAQFPPLIGPRAQFGGGQVAGDVQVAVLVADMDGHERTI